MTIYCTSKCIDGVYHGVVCDGQSTSQFDDEVFQRYYTHYGTPCDLRQHGISEFASNPGDAFNTSAIDRALADSVQNMMEFEIREPLDLPEEHFLCRQRSFKERQQACRIRLVITRIAELPTFIRAVEDIRSFEAMLFKDSPSPENERWKVAKLSDDLISRAEHHRLQHGFHIPICFDFDGDWIFGVVELGKAAEFESIVKWVNGPEKLEIGTKLLCNMNTNVHSVFAVLV